MEDFANQSVEKLKYSILYAEDDEFIRNGLVKILDSKFEKVFAAGDGAEALEIFKKEKPEIIITDIMMPKMTGLELSRVVKEIAPDTQIIVTTAYSDASFFMEAIDSGINKFLTKPVALQKMFTALREICAYIDMRREVKKNEKLLSEYKKAVDASSIVSIADKQGIITFVNDEFCRTSGFEREELIGAPHNIVRHPNMTSEVFGEMWSAILSGEVWNGLVENRAKNGESYWVEATVVPIMDENNEIVEFIGIRKDITDLVLQERELDRLRAKEMRASVDKAIKLNLKHLIELNPLPAFVIDEGDRIVEFNELFASIFDPFSDADKLEMLRSKNTHMTSVIAATGLLKEYGNSIIDWKDMLLGALEDDTLTPNSSKSDASYFPSIFEHTDNGEKFWVVYLKNNQ
jgi:PAS domain S-box-containing protein